MITKELIERINALAAKKKAEGLTEAEAKEQAELRQLYIAAFRENLESQLKNITLVDEDGTRHDVKKH